MRAARAARAICLAVYSETTYRAHPPSSKVVEKPAVRAVSRKDLVAGSTADTHKAVESELGHAKGGVLLVTDAHALLGAGGADKRGGDDYYGKLALEHLVSKVEEEELAAREKKDAPSIAEQAARRRSRVVLLLALRGDKVAHVLEAAPALGSLAPTCLEFAAYSAEEIGALIRQAVAARGFDLAPELVADTAKGAGSGVVLPGAAKLGACLPVSCSSGVELVLRLRARASRRRL